MRKRSALNAKEKSIWVRLLFSGYFLIMLWLLFGQRLGAEAPGSYAEYLKTSVNFEPFATVKLYISLLQRTNNPPLLLHAIVNLLGNVILFIPLGTLLPRIYPKLRSVWRLLLLVAAAITAVEILQFVTFLGSCDIDDLILNLLGAALGWVYWKLFLSKKER